MFEAGKVYSWKTSDETIHLYDCLYGDEKGALLVARHRGTRFYQPNDEARGFEEHHEPVVEEYIRSVNVNDHGGVYTANKVSGFADEVGLVKFTVTDGKLTGVAII